MNYFVYFIVYFVYGIITILQFLMMARAVMSWFVQDDSPSRIYDFLYYATEPVIYPVRCLLHKLGLDGDGMIDISFLVTVLILFAVQMMLPVISI
mgnify:CR=1 FL=1